MIIRQLKTILICLSAFAVLTVAYFAVIAPMLKTEVKTEPPIELLEGEARGSDNRVYMFPPATRATIKRIQVKNGKGTYVFYKKNSEFYIEGKETAPYDIQTAFPNIVVATGSSLALRRIEIDESTDLKVYGLDASQNPSSFTITTEDDTVHKVWVGNKIPTGGGYYCQYDGRNAIYVIGNTLSTAMESSVYDLITPTLGINVPTTSYANVSKLGVIKNGVPIFELRSLSPDENGTAGTDQPLMSYEFTLPADVVQYKPDTNAFTNVIYACSSLAGESVLSIGEELTDEKLAEYGIDPSNIHFAVYYTYDGIDCTIQFSEPDEDGYVNAYTSLYHMVVRLKLTSASFYNYKLSMYVDKYLYSTAIGDVSKITISGKIKDGVENIEVNSTFGLKKENNVQSLWRIENGEITKHFDADEITNFRKIYRDIIQLQLGGETDITEDDPDKKLLTVSMTDKNGKEMVFDFYAYSATRCYYTINGEKGAFYVVRSNVEQLIRDTYNFNNGYTLDPNV